jgi:hypothetical protein
METKAEGIIYWQRGWEVAQKITAGSIFIKNSSLREQGAKAFKEKEWGQIEKKKSCSS